MITIQNYNEVTPGLIATLPDKFQNFHRGLVNDLHNGVKFTDASKAKIDKYLAALNEEVKKKGTPTATAPSPPSFARKPKKQRTEEERQQLVAKFKSRHPAPELQTIYKQGQKLYLTKDKAEKPAKVKKEKPNAETKAAKQKFKVGQWVKIIGLEKVKFPDDHYGESPYNNKYGIVEHYQTDDVKVSIPELNAVEGFLEKNVKKVSDKEMYREVAKNDRKKEAAIRHKQMEANNKLMLKMDRERNRNQQKAEKQAKKLPPGQPIERLDEQHRIIARFLHLHDKEKTYDQLMSLLDYLQKAVQDKRINKDSKYVKQISHIQDELVSALRSLEKEDGKSITLTLTDAELNEYREIAGEYHPMSSVALLKRYISMDGKKATKEHVLKLIKSFEKNGIKADEKYSSQMTQALQNLREYLKHFHRGKPLEIYEAELSGLYGCNLGSIMYNEVHRMAESNIKDRDFDKWLLFNHSKLYATLQRQGHKTPDSKRAYFLGATLGDVQGLLGIGTVITKTGDGTAFAGITKKYTIKRFTKIGQQLTYYYDFVNDKWVSEKNVTSEFEFEFPYDSDKIQSFLKQLKSKFRVGHNDVRLYTSSLAGTTSIPAFYFDTKHITTSGKKNASFKVVAPDEPAAKKLLHDSQWAIPYDEMKFQAVTKNSGLPEGVYPPSNVEGYVPVIEKNKGMFFLGTLQKKKENSILARLAKKYGKDVLEKVSVLFHKDKFTVNQAKEWLGKHNLKFVKYEEGKNYHIFPQAPANLFKKNYFRMMTWKKVGADGLGALSDLAVPFIAGGIANTIIWAVMEKKIHQQIFDKATTVLNPEKPTQDIPVTDDIPSPAPPPASTSGLNRPEGVSGLEAAMNVDMKSVGLYGGWQSLIGDMCMPTSIFIYGNGGSGKSSCALMLSEFLSSLGHEVLYVAGEQYGTPSLKKLIDTTGVKPNPNFHLVKDMNTDMNKYQFVVLDSKDSFNLDVDEFRTLKLKHPNVSWIVTSQGTKSNKYVPSNFTGRGEWRNECDVIIHCEDGKAMTDDKNRWGAHGELVLFQK